MCRSQPGRGPEAHCAAVAWSTIDCAIELLEALCQATQRVRHAEVDDMRRPVEGLARELLVGYGNGVYAWELQSFMCAPLRPRQPGGEGGLNVHVDSLSPSRRCML